MTQRLGLLAVLLFMACTDSGDTGSVDTDGTDGTDDIEGTDEVLRGAPTAQDLAVEALEDIPSDITLRATEPNGDALTFAIAQAPSWGTTVLDGRTVRYTPDPDYNGSDSFTYTATDVDGTSAPATVDITVVPVNDPPTAVTSDRFAMVGQVVVLSAETTDIDGDEVTVSWSQSSGPSVVIDDDSTPGVRLYGAGRYTFDATADDGTETVDASMTVTVMDVSANREHALSVDPDGVAWSWGTNNEGQLGIPYIGQLTFPLPVCLEGVFPPCDTVFDDVLSMSAGPNYSLAVRSNGTVWAWGTSSSPVIGSNASGNPAALPGLADILAVSAGGRHAIALRSDGTVLAWGAADQGQLGNATTAPNRPAAGAVQVCTQAIVGGGCAALLTDVVAIEASRSDDDASLALDSSGTVWAWGSNLDGVLGHGCANDCSYISVAVPVCATGTAQANNCVPFDNVEQLALGGEVAMAVTTGGAAIGWGSNINGGLGIDCPGGPVGCEDEIQQPQPVCAPGEQRPCDGFGGIAQVAAGEEFTLFLTDDGTVYGVGNNSQGQIGTGCGGELDCRGAVIDVFEVCAPDQYHFGCEPLTDVVAIAAGGENSFALRTDGSLVGWGANRNGVVGSHRDGTLWASQVGTDTDWWDVAAGRGHTVALRDDGSVWGWGTGYLGRSGHCDLGTDIYNLNECDIVYEPEALTTAWGTPLTTGTAISAGDDHAGLVTADGSLYLWGSARDGALSTPTDLPLGRPTPLSTSNWADLSVGNNFTVGLATTGTVWAWGQGEQGQLGDDMESPSRVPVPVRTGSNGLSDNDWDVIDAGSDFVLALKQNGTLWGWGDNSSGQLANGDVGGRFTASPALGPVGTAPPTDWFAISAGRDHAVGLRGTGTLWFWGNGTWGRAGNDCLSDDSCGQWSPVTTPIEVLGPNGGPSVSDWVTVAAADSHTLAVRADGTVWAWGQNSGNIGTGLLTDHSVPTAICRDFDTLTFSCAAGLDDVVTVSASDDTGFAIRGDGTLWSWGYNSNGTLGYGRPEQGSPTPVYWPALDH